MHVHLGVYDNPRWLRRKGLLTVEEMRSSWQGTNCRCWLFGNSTIMRMYFGLLTFIPSIICVQCGKGVWKCSKFPPTVAHLSGLLWWIMNWQWLGSLPLLSLSDQSFIHCISSLLNCFAGATILYALCVFWMYFVSRIPETSGPAGWFWQLSSKMINLQDLLITFCRPFN